MSVPFPFASEFSKFRLLTSGGDNAEVGSQRINIPEEAKWLYFILGGSGNNGGNGHTAVAGSKRGGGGAGGSGATACILIPNSIWMPSVLYALLPSGGSSWFSYLGLTHAMVSGVSISLNYSRTILTAAPGFAGGNGSGTAGGTGGAGGALPSSSGLGWNSLLGPITGIAGRTGIVGSADATPVSDNDTFSSSSNFLSGGAGGGGLTAASSAFSVGGHMNPSLLAELGKISGGIADGQDGGSGFNLISTFGLQFSGGAGGASSDAGTGGKGGLGGPGCGGGGGGGGATGGQGGKGGGGFLFMGWS